MKVCGPGWRSQYSDLLRTGGSGDQILWGGRGFPRLSRQALGPFPAGKAAGAWR